MPPQAYQQTLQFVVCQQCWKHNVPQNRWCSCGMQLAAQASQGGHGNHHGMTSAEFSPPRNANLFATPSPAQQSVHGVAQQRSSSLLLMARDFLHHRMIHHRVIMAKASVMAKVAMLMTMDLATLRVA